MYIIPPQHSLKNRSGRADDETRAAILARLEPIIQQRVTEAMASEATQKRIQRRLLDERARLEAKVTAQIDAERRALLERRRQESALLKAQSQQQALDLDRILEENKRKLEEARQRAVAQQEQGGGGGGGGHAMHQVRVCLQRGLGDPLFMFVNNVIFMIVCFYCYTQGLRVFDD